MRISSVAGVAACLAVGGAGKCLAAGPPSDAAAGVKVESGPTTTLLKRADDCTWMESQAAASASSPADRPAARVAAIQEARRSSLREFLRGRSLAPNRDGPLESGPRAGHLGPVLMENPVAENYDDLPGCAACRYRVTLRDCLSPPPRNLDEGFRIDLGLSRDLLLEGDKVAFTVTASRDSYIYVYHVRWNGQTTIVAPDRGEPPVRLKAGETWAYPPPARTLGGGDLSLAAELSWGKSVSRDAIRVIASKTPLPEKITDPTSGGFQGVLRRLHASGFQWTEDSQEFTIAAGRAGSSAGGAPSDPRPPQDSPTLPSDQTPSDGRSVPLLR